MPTYCTACGRVITHGDRYCWNCGISVSALPAAPPPQGAPKSSTHSHEHRQRVGQYIWVIAIGAVASVILLILFTGPSTPPSPPVSPAEAGARAQQQQAVEAKERTGEGREEAFEASQHAAQDAASEKEQRDLSRAIITARIMRSAMRNPDSFKLIQVILMPSGVACFDYRAENGFGGMNRDQAVLYHRTKIVADDDPRFPALWNRECADKVGQDVTNTVAAMSRGSH